MNKTPIISAGTAIAKIADIIPPLGESFSISNDIMTP